MGKVGFDLSEEIVRAVVAPTRNNNLSGEFSFCFRHHWRRIHSIGEVPVKILADFPAPFADPSAVSQLQCREINLGLAHQSELLSFWLKTGRRCKERLRCAFHSCNAEERRDRVELDWV